MLSESLTGSWLRIPCFQETTKSLQETTVLYTIGLLASEWSSSISSEGHNPAGCLAASSKIHIDELLTHAPDVAAVCEAHEWTPHVLPGPGERVEGEQEAL